MIFYLGTHEPSWLGRTGYPLFISRVRLFKRKTLPRALGNWSLDSGGFSELSLKGVWSLTATEYTREVRRYMGEIGRMQWAAAQDWMCEPFITKKTGLSVSDHQMRTVHNYVELMNMASDIPWVPVLQGYTEADYLNCIDLYGRSGIDLRSLRLVGLGSVCRRQGTKEVETLVRRLKGEYGLKLHGFGFKVVGLGNVSDALSSSDSMAWSMSARLCDPLPICQHSGKCNNCLNFALEWRSGLLYRIKHNAYTKAISS